MTQSIDDTTVELSDCMSSPPFTERHTRLIAQPIEVVWPHCLSVTAAEVRALGPLMKLRKLPGRLRRGRLVEAAAAPAPLLDAFAAGGFVFLRNDAAPVDGRAVVLFGAVGTFWSPSNNAPVSFESDQEFRAFDEPGYAKTVANLEAIDLGDGTTRLVTETWVTGTDTSATARFAPYWAIIRGPSGLIRRSWLAAIDRRVRAQAAR